MNDLDYSIYVENENNKETFNIIINFNQNSHSTNFELKQIHNFYQFLIKLKELFNSKNIPQYLIFFVKIIEKNSNKEINNYESFSSIMSDSSNLIFEITENENFILIDNDSSIIRILDKIVNYFQIIIEHLNYMDIHLNFKKKESLYLIFKQSTNLYNSISNYMKDDKVIFLKNEYPFSKDTVL